MEAWCCHEIYYPHLFFVVCLPLSSLHFSESMKSFLLLVSVHLKIFVLLLGDNCSLSESGM